MKTPQSCLRLLMLCTLSFFLTACFSFNSLSNQKSATNHRLGGDVSAIDYVWSGHPIKPYLLTKGDDQFVAYFDANRQMTIAHRVIGKPWRFHKVDSWLGWDSHNYVTMELDKKGYLHVMGNMHGDNLEYFRMTEPMAVRSIERIDVMVDEQLESRMTYPIFLLNKQKELIVKYRHGGSGNGDEIYNIYSTETKVWQRLHANQFLNGEGLMSGYFEGLIY
ncbi:MAG: BNR repeat-containing protein [Paraglaciecola sp.]|uniref:BNR-4 repeat-containing protein n=1 Tax=Paraglaciecola sp. TaxID=1920173 RepID=UPI00273D69E0|nr:BNR-4 repeat-containing protein [Paraglaciecola sp.]MDP5030237.1 BNR repeat-containing protein [Paraglaciecola sp.]MDP5130754.1 BNR repeat-containing protein [Paraglaciecola sp.]